MNENGLVHKATEWCYQGLWGILASYFKLPKTPPNLPSLEGEHVEYLHPSEEYLKYRKFEFWVVLFIVDIALSVAWIALIIAVPWLGILITPLALAIIILPDIFAYIGIHLNYDTTWYVLSDRSMRLRQGVWTLQETTITFENIQNINIQQGPLQRWFGFSNLVVQTAGGGGGAGGGKHAAGSLMHMGVLVGLANAQEIRERILARCGNQAGAGLGEELATDKHQVDNQPTLNQRRNLELLREINDLTASLAKATN
jgi:membrane protein YdbS with pleckstrin-like domain